MNTPTSALRRFHARNVRYFAHLGDRAARTNLRQLQTACVAYALFLIGYGALTHLLTRSWPLTLCFLAFSVVNLPFLPFAFRYARRTTLSSGMVQTACLLFMLTVLAFAVVSSIFPFPDRPGLLFPLAYLMMSVLFVLPCGHVAGLLTGAAAVYLALTLWCKTPAVRWYDSFAALTTWILGLLLLCVISDLRMRDGDRLLELDRLSRTDALTGLPNRRMVEGEMPRVYRRCQCSGMWVAAMMVDVDDFKNYNDLLGHPAGDLCLQTLGRAIRVFADDLGVYAARYGGEEFLLFLPNCAEQEALTKAEELLDRIRALKIPITEQTTVTVSIGLAVELPGESGGYEDLLCRADEALYRAKDAGKNCVELWREPAQDPAHRSGGAD